MVCFQLKEGEGPRAQSGGQLQKGCKNVVKELLTGGGRAVAVKPGAGGEFVSARLPGCSLLPFTLLLCLFLLNLKSDLFQTALHC